MTLNLSSLKSVSEFVTEFLAKNLQLDLLINNAGIMMCPFTLSEDGIELQMATNHVGHFSLTTKLLPKLKNNPNGARIVNVSSIAHQTGTMTLNNLETIFRPTAKQYSPQTAYGNSKLANILFTKELSVRLKDTKVMCYSLHPGVIP